MKEFQKGILMTLGWLAMELFFICNLIALTRNPPNDWSEAMVIWNGTMVLLTLLQGIHKLTEKS